MSRVDKEYGRTCFYCARRVIVILIFGHLFCFAATVVYLQKTGTKVVFKAEEPFLFLIRHDRTKLPIFYGAVLDPREG